jgi:cellulose synthase/poly-beta-1,6-N-acetylglucosamine synthase-like glycosyltransferase
MEFVFFLSLFLIAYPYLGYPLILWFLAMLWGRKIVRQDITPTLTLIISAYNEEEIIAAKLANSLELDYPKDRLEIVVASESDDRTNEIVRGYESQGVKLFNYSTREGKTATLFRVVPRTRGEVLVFSDANAFYQPDAIRKLVRNFADSRVGVVCGQLCYRNPKKTAAGKAESLYWRYENWLKTLASRLLSLNGVNGSIFALRREAFLPLNRFRGDDFELAVNAAIHGHGVVFEPEAVSVEEASDTFYQEFNRRVRIISWMFGGARLLLKKAAQQGRWLVAFQLLSHKIIRWCVPVFMVLLFISNLWLAQEGHLFYLFLFFGQLSFYGIAVYAFISNIIRGRPLPRGVTLIYYFCTVNLAALVGLFKSVRIRSGTVWEKNR